MLLKNKIHNEWLIMARIDKDLFKGEHYSHFTALTALVTVDM